MTVKIPTDTFIALTCEIADWLMSSELGDKKYQTMLIQTDKEISYTEEGQDIFNEWNYVVEHYLSTYFQKEDK